MSYLLGIDLGTSGTKTVLFDEKGNNKAWALEEYPLYQLQNGWAEQDPNLWWEAVVNTTKSVIKKSDINIKDIKGIGVSGQMHGLVMLDKCGNVIRHSIIWCDGRTSSQCGEITEKIGAKRLIEITANPALTGFTAGKILWVRENEPENYEKCCHIMLPKDYIVYKLTGEFVTEVSDASGMNLLDVTNRCWSDEVLTKLDIEKSKLGKMHESIDVVGEISKIAAKLTGLAEGTLVVGGAGDNAAAAIGTGVVKSGKSFATIGTSGVIFAHSDKVSIDLQGRVHTFCSAVPNAWSVMSCTLSAGLSLRWLRDTMCQEEISEAKKMGIDTYELMTNLAKQSPIGANRLLFLPYLMGERSPILDEKARGVFFGLSASHKKGDIIRSLLEGVTYSQRSCYDVLKEMGITSTDMMICGGGARSEFWRQMLADLLGCTVKTANVSLEGPALGVAILAGVGSGVYKDLETACDTIIKADTAIIPDSINRKKYNKFYNLYNNLYPTLKGSFAELQQLGD